MQLGLAFVHLGVDGSTPDIRRRVNLVLQAASVRQPELTNLVMRDAMAVFLSRAWTSTGPVTSTTTTAAGSTEESSAAGTPWNKHTRLSALLLSAVNFGPGVDAGVRENAIANLIIVAHHTLVCACIDLVVASLWVYRVLIVFCFKVDRRGRLGSICVKGRVQIHGNW